MNPRSWLLTGTFFALCFQANASNLDCPPNPTSHEIVGVTITITPEKDGTKCRDRTTPSKYLHALERLAESSWPLPIGWSPFPGAVVDFRFSDDGALIDAAIVESTSFDISACGYQVLESAAQELASQFPQCLSGLFVSADIKVPWNSIGIIKQPLEDAPTSSTTFEAGDLEILNIGDLERFTPALDIKELDSFEPND
jgi:hypothetical protein